MPRCSPFALLASFLILCPLANGAPLVAAITGTVRDAQTSLPIEGAIVHLQTEASPSALTDVNGAFMLGVEPTGLVRVTAAVTYDRTAPRNWTTGGVLTTNGANVTIELDPIPELDNLGYQPIKAATPGGCGDCHPTQLAQWQGSAHANAAIDSWVLDLFSGSGTPNGSAGYVYTDVHPGETGTCATCHSPALEAQSPGTGFLDQATTAAELEGVTCSACHQLDHIAADPTMLHTVGDAPSTWRFPDAGPATHEYVWGPLDDVDYPFMRASLAPVFASSLMCASCHEYVNQETGVPGQTTYTEWLASSYAVPGDGMRTCQNCHMPASTVPGPIADPTPGSAPTRPASQNHDHGFVGATPATLAEAIDLSTVVRIDGGRLEVDATVLNSGAGHSFPTGISIRNALVVIEARREGELLDQLSGPTVPWWANDDDAEVEPGDWAGWPGTGFAKVLEGTVSGTPTAPVLFVDATGTLENSSLPAGQARQSVARFDLGAATAGDQVTVVTRLLYRRAWRALSVTKGWTTTPTGGPIEIEVASRLDELSLGVADLTLFADGFESGTTGAWSAVGP